MLIQNMPPSLDEKFGEGWAVRCAVAGHSRSCACCDPPSDLAGLVVEDTAESSIDPPRIDTGDGEDMLKSDLRGRPNGRLLNGGVLQQEGAMEDGELVEVCLKIREAVALREKYRMPAEREPPGASSPVKAAQNPGNVRGWPFVAPPWTGRRGFRFELRRGVMVVWQEAQPAGEAGSPTRRRPTPAAELPAFAQPPGVEDFTADLQRRPQRVHEGAMARLSEASRLALPASQPRHGSPSQPPGARFLSPRELAFSASGSPGGWPWLARHNSEEQPCHTEPAERPRHGH